MNRIASVLVLLSLAACDPVPVTSAPASIPTGAIWGPCDLAGASDADSSWWGCEGELGEGLACLRPVSDQALSICAPQTWDPTIDDDCGGLTSPFGLGVRVAGSAYCVPDCETDADCGPDLACSPSSHFCAWVGE